MKKTDIQSILQRAKIYPSLEYLKKTISTNIDPVKAAFHCETGNIHRRMGNLKEAGMAYLQAVEADPDYVPTYNNLGMVYQQLGEDDKALAAFRKGLELAADNAVPRFNYGLSLEAISHLEDAANEYSTALHYRPGWPDPAYNLGIILFRQGHYDKALAAFNRILGMDRFNAEVHNNIGVVFAAQGKTEEAAKNLRQALEVNLSYIKAAENLQKVLTRNGVPHMDAAACAVDEDAAQSETPMEALEAELPAGLSLPIPKLISLLDCLKQLTEALPDEDRGFYLQSQFPAELESVIDRLKKLSTPGDT